jgi:hypothetical protein
MSNEVRKEEAHGATAKVEWRGHEFEVSREFDDWSVDFLESLEEGKSVGIVRGAIGAKAWRQVQAMDLRVRDLNELAGLVAAAMGFGSAGESSASSE